MSGARVIDDNVRRIRAEIMAVESAQGRFDHGPQRVAETVARVRADMRESDALRGIDSGAIGHAIAVTAAQVVGPPILIGVVAGAWTRSWQAGLGSGALSLLITGGMWWWTRRQNESGAAADARTIAERRSNPSWEQSAWLAMPRATLRPDVGDDAACRRQGAASTCFACPPGLRLVAGTTNGVPDYRCAPQPMGA